MSGNKHISTPDEHENTSNVMVYDNDDAYLLYDGTDKAEIDNEEDHNQHYETQNYNNENNDNLAEEDYNEGEEVHSLNTTNSNKNQFLSINCISICQNCNANFTNYAKKPLLYKCGHFFCKECIINYFTDEQANIICPIDGIVANNISTLKILKNLILDNTENSNEALPLSSGKEPKNDLKVRFSYNNS